MAVGKGRGSHASSRFGGTRGTAGARLASGRGNKGGSAARTLATGSAGGRKVSVGGQAVLAGKGTK